MTVCHDVYSWEIRVLGALKKKKGAIIRNRRPEEEKSRFCVTWRQLCSFFRDLAKAVGLFAGRPFPVGLNSQCHIIPPSQCSRGLREFIPFHSKMLRDLQLVISSRSLVYASSVRLFWQSRVNHFIENDHLSLKWDTQDKRLHAAVISARWETSVGPPTFHSFGRRADRICVYGLLIRNRWRSGLWSCTLTVS